MNLKGTKTELNLWEAIKGESLATNKYLYFSKIARNEGYQQIGDILEETSRNERAHARIWLKQLKQLGNTKENLQACIDGENQEYTEMYPQFSKEAKKEGFNEIARLFSMVGEIEKEHRDRYMKLLDNLKNNKIFKKETSQEWICLECGNIIKGNEVSISSCPVCEHPKGYIAINNKNY